MTIRSLENNNSSIHYNKPDINSKVVSPQKVKTDVKTFDTYTKTRLKDSHIYTKDGTKIYNRILNRIERTEVSKTTLQADSFVRSRPLGNKIYNSTGKLIGESTNKVSINDSYKSLKLNVKEQIEFLFGKFLKDEDNQNDFDNSLDQLKTFYQNNPQALDQISQGKIPDYFNVENTAKRQFDIALWSYNEDDDINEFYNKAVDLINLAYEDTEKRLPFELPGIVKDTKEAVLYALEQFKDGVNKDDIKFTNERMED